MEYSEPPQLENDEDEVEASPLSGLLEQQEQEQPVGVGQGIIKVDELADGSLVVEPSDDQELFDDFLGRVNDISEATGASDFETEVIPLLQREIPGLRVYEIEEEEEEGDDEEPSLDDFRDVEDYAKAVSDLMETEHEENQIQEQQQRNGGRLEKRGQQQANILMPNNLFFDYPSDDDND